jgi:hypothetical protein
VRLSVLAWFAHLTQFNESAIDNIKRNYERDVTANDGKKPLFVKSTEYALLAHDVKEVLRRDEYRNNERNASASCAENQPTASVTQDSHSVLSRPARALINYIQS